MESARSAPPSRCIEPDEFIRRCSDRLSSDPYAKFVYLVSELTTPIELDSGKMCAFEIAMDTWTVVANFERLLGALGIFLGDLGN